jgi:hypothetical protein
VWWKKPRWQHNFHKTVSTRWKENHVGSNLNTVIFHKAIIPGLRDGWRGCNWDSSGYSVSACFHCSYDKYMYVIWQKKCKKSGTKDYLLKMYALNFKVKLNYSRIP